MAPPKVLLGQNRQTSTINLRNRVTTRSQNASISNVVKQSISRDTRTKRKAEASPPKEKTVKRSAFTNITNVCTIIVILLDINIYAVYLYQSIVICLYYYFLYALCTIFLSLYYLSLFFYIT